MNGSPFFFNHASMSTTHWEADFIAWTRVYDSHTLQLFRQYPSKSFVPTMYREFFPHSPAAAHSGQCSSSSEHPTFKLFLTGRSKDLTWIHFVADHFSPSMTGQLPCRLFGSVVALTWRLKKSRASPLLGFTARKKKKTVNGEGSGFYIIVRCIRTKKSAFNLQKNGHEMFDRNHDSKASSHDQLDEILNYKH